MSTLLCAFLLLLNACLAWKIDSTHTFIRQGVTDNVTIHCCYDNDDNSMPRLKEVSRILIRRRESESNKSTDPWSTYAKIYNGHFSPVLVAKGDLGVKVRGLAHEVKDSFLSVTWPTASQGTTGQYVCEVNGYDVEDSLIKVVTQPIRIDRSPLDFQYLLRMVLNLKKSSDDTLNRIQSNLTQIIKDVSKLKTFHERRKVTWPGGRYALLKTSSGCQMSDSVRWIDGYIRLKGYTETTDKVESEPSFLSEPFQEQASNSNNSDPFSDFLNMYIRTCKQETPVGGPDWPKGSYCVHRVGAKCPNGFHKKTLFSMDSRYTGEIDVNADGPETDKSLAPGSVSALVSNVLGCCRWDEQPTTPVSLPVEEPFIVYRYPNANGTCQQVLNSTVAPGWFKIIGVVPSKTTTVHFCYYQTKQRLDVHT